MSKPLTPPLRFRGFEEEWEKTPLLDFATIYGGLTYSPNDVATNGTLVLRSSNVKDSRLISADDVFVRDAAVNVQNVAQGDIVMVVRNGSKSLIGKHAPVIQDMPGTVIGAFMSGLRTNSPFFCSALFETEAFSKEVGKNGGATINQITNGMFRDMSFYIPCASEQGAIGDYFQRIDALIAEAQSELDRLEKMKLASLQKMFPRPGNTTPQIRFKGFGGEWVETKLGEIGSTYNGLSGKSKKDFGHGEGRYITYMNVFSNPIASINQVDAIEVDDTQTEVQCGDVLFTTSSETPEEVGMSSIWEHNLPNTYLNSFCFGFRPSIVLDSNYLAYYLRTPIFRSKMVILGQGISRYNISKNKAMELPMFLPSMEEQHAIGNYFRNLDALIAEKRERVTKLRNIKKACLDRMFVNSSEL